jgi:hypothetical protein
LKKKKLNQINYKKSFFKPFSKIKYVPIKKTKRFSYNSPQISIEKRDSSNKSSDKRLSLPLLLKNHSVDTYIHKNNLNFKIPYFKNVVKLKTLKNIIRNSSIDNITIDESIKSFNSRFMNNETKNTIKKKIIVTPFNFKKIIFKHKKNLFYQDIDFSNNNRKNNTRNITIISNKN